jgi:hypothetical protein
MWITKYPLMEGAGDGSGGGAGSGGAPDGDGGGGLPTPPGGGGPGPGTPWYSALAPEGTELPPIVKEAPDFATFVKVAQDLKAMTGDSIRIPGPEASEEVKAEFQKKLAERVPGVYYMPDPENQEQITALQRKLGAPDSPEGYTFTPPEGGDLDEGLTANYRNWANELNLTQHQADEIYKRFNTYQLAAVGELQSGHQEGLAQLKAEMGVTYPDRLKKIDFLLSKYEGTEVMRESLKTEQFPAHVVRLFNNMADGLLGEGMQMVGSGEGTQPTGMPPAEAAARAAEVRANPAFLDEAHPEHKAMVAKHVEYMKMAHPEASQQAPARAGFG